METEFLFDEMLEVQLSSWGRLNPLILTEADIEHERFWDLTKFFTPAIFIHTIESPGWLYNFLKTYNDATVIFLSDLLQMRKNYIDLIEGAVCSSPESMCLWQVNYTGKASFTFKGRILICTKLTRQEIQKRKNLEFIRRDCRIVNFREFLNQEK